MSDHYLTAEPIDTSVWHAEAGDPRDGAAVEFLGMVRTSEKNRPVRHLDYEAYEPMAERVIDGLINEAKRRWPLHRVFVRHRIGRVAVGEIAVLIGVQSPHRDEAFEACRFLIDAIKRDAPIWKAAIGLDGACLAPRNDGENGDVSIFPVRGDRKNRNVPIFGGEATS